MSHAPILDCLIWLTKYHHLSVQPEAILSGLPLDDGRLSESLLERAAANAGLSIYKKLLDSVNLARALPQACLPCMAWMDESPVLIVRLETGFVEVLLPGEFMRACRLDVNAFMNRSRMYVLLFSSAPGSDDRDPDLGASWREHWLWGALWEGSRIYREVLLVSLLVNLFALAVPLFVRLIYDRVIPGLALGTLDALTTGVLLVITFELVCRYLRNRFIDLAAKKSDLLISGRIYAKLMAMDMSSRPAAVGAFARQVQDFEAIREFMTSTCLTALVDIPFAVIFLLVIAVMSGYLVWVPVLAILFMIIVSLSIQPALRRTIEESERLSARRHGDLVESLTGLESLRLAGAQWRFQKRWEQAIGHIATWGLKTRSITGGVSVLAIWIQQLTTVTIVYFGVLAITTDTINLGALIAVMMLTGRAIAPFMQLALLSTRYHQARTAYHVTEEMMVAPEEATTDHSYRPIERLAGGIICNQLSFTYPQSAIPALNILSLHIKPGEKVAIAGRSGSGKSTLARVLAALYSPEQGQIQFDGIDIGDIHPMRLREKIGFLSQEPWLFHGTIHDNITLGNSVESDEALLEVAEAAGVTTFTGKSLAALEYPVGEGGQRLSGGQRRAVALARAMLNKPDVLILDEPTAHMDSFLESHVCKTLERLPGHTTLLLMTHRSSLISAVNRIVVIDAGRLVSDRSSPAAETSQHGR